MINQVINFSLKLIAALLIVFGIHLFILNKLQVPLFKNLIIEAYITNIFLVICIYTTLLILKNKYLDLLGFVFMGGSFLKFGVFFIFFYPYYKQDETLTRLETTSFLIPYIAALIIETYYLVKLLNKDG
jgi:predicted MFS family arabinose efflux permease